MQDGRISLSLQEPYVTFATNLAVLTDVDKENLSKLAGILSWPITLGSMQSITVVGHTDITGTPQRNAGLSLERAEAVRSYLISVGVPEGLLSPPEGKGERQPFPTHSDQPQSEIIRLNVPSLRVKNRRVEVLIRKRPGPSGTLSCD